MSNESEVTEVKEGDIVYKLNDTVYLAPENLNEAYYLGRIMEFVNDQTGAATQAKIAWYLRPKDILGKKKNFDSRLLLATMHYDINPVSSIRGKCTIKHSSHIDDLEAYKQREDTFYYNKLYDRYSQRLYDVVPVELIRNLSDTLLQAFYPYKFIIVDDGKASDFIERRECAVCGKWVDSEVLLDCLHCHRKFHMYCIDPPLTKKPPKGYAWECLECLGALADSDSDGSDNPNSLMKMDESRSSSIKEHKGINKKLEKILKAVREQQEREKNEPPPKRNLIPPNADQFKEPKWPFMYFGDISHRDTFLTDNLDPTDIYPKTCSRLGKKYQSDIPDLLTPNEIEEQKKVNIDDEIMKYDASLENENQERSHNSFKSKGRKKRGKFKEVPVALRGSKYELVYSKPDDWKDEKVNDYIKNIKECHPDIQNMDLFDRALLELHRSNYDIDHSFSIMKDITLKDLDLPTWSKSEIKQFENGIIKYGHELQYVKQEVPTKRRKDVVQYFYRWKKSPRYRLIYSQFCKVHRPGKVFADLENINEDTEKDEKKSNKTGDDTQIKSGNEELNIKREEDSSGNKINKSVNKKEEEDKKPPEEIFCSNCHILITPDENSASQTMCEECLIYWLKYYTPKPISDKKNKDNAKLKRKREEEKIKLKKRTIKRVKSQQSSEQDVSNIDDLSKIKTESQVEEPEEIIVPCSICLDSIDTHWNPIIQCSNCDLRVHKNCYGVSDIEVHSWQCSRCRNRDNQRSSLNYTCVLCNIKKDSNEDAVKLTISNNWAHVLCSLFIPEIKYGNAKTMEPIECINLIDEKKWKKKCVICNETYGVCVTCHWKGCSKTFHVTCASMNHQKFSIEESGRNGNLYAAIYCSDHTQLLMENESYSDMDMNDDSIRHNMEGLNITEDIERYILDYKQVNSKNSNNNLISQVVPEECKCHYINSVDIKNSERSKENSQIDDDIIIQCKKCNEKVSPIWWKRKDLLEMIDELVDEAFEEEEEEEEEEEKEEEVGEKKEKENKRNSKMDIDNNRSLLKEEAKQKCIDYVIQFLSKSNNLINNINTNNIKSNEQQTNNNIIPLTLDKSLYCHKCYWQMKRSIINQLSKYDSSS